MSRTLTVEGTPAPKERPRCTGHGAVTTEKTKVAEQRIGWAWKEKYGAAMYQGSVSVQLAFFEPAGHPADLDNLTKLVLDALNGIAWSDDRQVIRLKASVVRKTTGTPMTRILIEGYGDEYDEPEAQPG